MALASARRRFNTLELDILVGEADIHGRDLMVEPPVPRKTGRTRCEPLQGGVLSKMTYG